MWPFTRPRKPKPPEDHRVWNEDWAAGDLAECVAGSWGGNPGPKVGSINRIIGVKEGIGHLGSLIYALEFQRHPDYAYECTAFRKIRPAEGWRENWAGYSKKERNRRLLGDMYP